MKYAAFFICLFISIQISTSAEARTIFSFKQSDAIQSIANMLSENAEDLKVSFQISDKKNIIKDTTQCSQVESNVALLSFKEAMDSVLRMFPDEEIPYNEAMADMKDYLDMTPLTLCKFVRAGIETQVITLYFFDKSDKIHLRIDKTIRP